MKATKQGILALLLLLVFAADALAAHQIAQWPKKKKGAVSLTFDDACESQISVGIPALAERKMKGTFYLITDKVTQNDRWGYWRYGYLAGQEMGSHTQSHPYLTTLSSAQVQDEMGGSISVIEAQIPRRQCLTFAYPYGDFNSQVQSIAENDFIAARGVSCALNEDPVDFYDLRGCQIEDGADLFAYADLAQTRGAWLVPIFHTLVGGSDCWGIVDTATFLDYLDYLQTKDLWIEPVDGVAKYVRERNSASLSVVSSSSTQIVLRLTDSLDDAIFDQPLGIRSEIPSNWLSVDVRQGGAVTVVSSALEGSTRVVYYDAVPDGGNITLTPSAPVGAPGSPTVGTLSVSGVTTTGAIMYGKVNPNGAPTNAWFEWGTAPALTSYATTATQGVGSGNSLVPVSATLAGLTPWTRYYFRAAAQNSVGVTRGEIKTFSAGDYYVAVGDSITAGSHDDILGDGVGYEPILTNLLTAEKGYPHTVMNAGVSGDDSADGFTGIAAIVGNYPDAGYFLVMYGTNDAYSPAISSGLGLSPGDFGYDDTYKDYLQRIIWTITDVGKKALLAKVPYTTDPQRSLSMIRDYNSVVDELAASNSIETVPPDFYNYFRTHLGELADGVHPNGVGYQSMASLWADELSPPAANAVTLSPSPASPQLAGTSITFTAAASGGSGTYEYEFRGRRVGDPVFSVVQAYSPWDTWNWTSVAGSWEIRVNARNAGSTSAAEATQTVTYVVN